ncbi:MAG: hypothetical protein KDC54_18970, partial [Lewinella sp.]|nr:hypothetical protein [Lewinella sp.]
MPVLSRIPRLVLCLFLLGSRVGDLCAQPYSYIQYTTADGLPTNYVYGVVEDEEGYIWAYTENGLAKFDGYEFTTLSVSDGLPGPDVTYAERGPDGKIWLQTYRNRPAYLYRDSVHVIGHQTCVINQISEGVVCYGCGDKYLIIREGAQLVYLATGEVSTALVAAYPRFFRFQYALENQGQQPEFSRLELVYARSGDSLRFYQPTGVLTRIPLPSGGEIYRYNDEWLIWRDTAGQWQEVLLTQGGSSLRLGRLLTIGERTIYLLTRGAGQILLIDLEQASGKEINLYELGLSPRYAA